MTKDIGAALRKAIAHHEEEIKKLKAALAAYGTTPPKGAGPKGERMTSFVLNLMKERPDGVRPIEVVQAAEEQGRSLLLPSVQSLLSRMLASGSIERFNQLYRMKKPATTAG